MAVIPDKAVIATANPIHCTWARRNRLTESTPLSWTDPDQTPEAGQTTTIIVYKLDGVTEITRVTGLTGTSHDLPWSAFGGNDSAILKFISERDGYESLSGYAIQVTLPNLTISGTPVLTATKGLAYTGFTAAAHFGTPPYAYSLVGAWPAGVSINSTTGVISGTPTVAGSFAGLSVRVTDAASDTADLPAFTLPVAAAVGHRHWRIVCTAGSGGYYSLTEVLMRSELGGSVNLSVAANGVATASGFPNSTYSPDKAIDGDAATSWTVLKAVGMWWKFSFTAPQAIEEVEIFANSAESVNHPTSFRIEHSDDDATWTVWKTVEGIPAWGAGTGQRRIFNNGGGTELPRHWRFVFTEYLHGTYVNVEGVQFRSTSGGPNRVVLPGGSATGNKDTVSGTNPGMAFDGIANTGWEANHSSTTSVLQWTQPPGHGIDVTEYLIGPGPFANEAPKAWSLQWSRNGYTWQTSDTRSGQTGWTANTPRTFSATTTIGA